jgi:hypothetical protein
MAPRSICIDPAPSSMRRLADALLQIKLLVKVEFALQISFGSSGCVQYCGVLYFYLFSA